MTWYVPVRAISPKDCVWTAPGPTGGTWQPTNLEFGLDVPLWHRLFGGWTRSYGLLTSWRPMYRRSRAGASQLAARRVPVNGRAGRFRGRAEPRLSATFGCRGAPGATTPSVRASASRVSADGPAAVPPPRRFGRDRKSTRLNSSHSQISYAVFCLKKTYPRRAGGGRLQTPLCRHPPGERGGGVARVRRKTPPAEFCCDPRRHPASHVPLLARPRWV